MIDRNSMNREIKKNQLRRQIVSSSPQEGTDSQEIIKKSPHQGEKEKDQDRSGAVFGVYSRSHRCL